MPEGDTIFRAARTLQRALAGRVVTRFDTAYALLARVHDDTPITGRTIEAVEAHGKHMVMRFSGDLTGSDAALSRAASGGPSSARLQFADAPPRVDRTMAPDSVLAIRRADAGRVGGAWRGPLVLRTHMRMHGSWHIYRPGERWQRPPREMRIVIGTADFVAVAFNVPDAEFERGIDVGARDAIARLGPDLLAPDFDAAEAVRRLQARGAMTIAEALLDQRALAGIGNVFKSEVLFEGGVEPFAAVATIAEDRLAALVAIARRQLAANVAPSHGGYGRRTTGRLAPSEGLWVYGRGGRPCRRCGTPISFAKQGVGARPTYWCPTCQPGSPSFHQQSRTAPGT
jgi:endonuclease VIII